MNLKIGKDEFILLLMYIEAIVFGFVGQTQNFNRLILLLIILRLFCDYKHCMRDLLWFYLYIMLFAINIVINGGRFDIGIRNFLVFLYPLSQAYFILYLCRYKRDVLKKCFDRGFWLFNITAVLNLLAAFVQCFMPGIITPVNIYDYTVMSVDNISGLFGYGATHTLCLFMIFIIIYNTVKLRQTKSKLKRYVMLLYLLIITIAMCVISIIGDNKAFFLMLPVSAVLYYALINLRTNNQKAILKLCVLVVFVTIMLLIFYNINSLFKSLVDKYILRTLNIAWEAIGVGNEAYGSTERIAIIGFAFAMLSTWILGTGFGSAMVFESGYMGFAHFGQADLGALLILGGIWITLFIVIMYCNFFMSMALPQGRRNVICWLSMVFFVLVTCLYTQCFTRTDIMFCLIMLMLSLQHEQRIKNPVKNVKLHKNH